jgi:hypothetical protein
MPMNRNGLTGGTAVRFRRQMRRAIALMATLSACVLLVIPSQRALAQSPGDSYCSRDRWTQVHWYVHPFWPSSYRYTVSSGVRVDWRWFSSEPPFYWEGNFTSQGDIWSPPAWYTSVEFRCSPDSPVWVRGLP